MGRGRMLRRAGTRLAVLVAIGALVAGPMASAVGASDGPRSWQVGAGTSTKNQAVQVNAFLPRDFTVDVGDTVTWTVKSGEFHTVTFLSGAAAPPLIVFGPTGPQFNLAAVAPSGGPTYDGTGINNSGLLNTGQQHSVTFTAAGDFHFVCLVHSTMQGTLHVHAAGTPYPASQHQLDVRARTAGNRLRAAGRELEARTLAEERENGHTSAAVGTGALRATLSLAVMRFLPGRIVIHAGQTVTWTNHDPETPHTITFGTEPPGAPLGAFAPSGVDGPGHATIGSTTQSVNSGVVGAGLPFGTSFSATFTAPGTYHFICALHDQLGMTGTVVVLP